MSTKIPLGIFWDIENCKIPPNKDVSSVVKLIRMFVAVQHPECGFTKVFDCTCDSHILGKPIAEGLDKSGVTVVHVNSTAKNAAEDKLQELIDMFVDNYGGTGSAVLCIISSDINVAKQIRNARRKDLDVLLIHSHNCSTALKNSVDELYLYEDIVKNAKNILRVDNDLKPAFLNVSNLPINGNPEAIERRLSQLSNNCGGKPLNIKRGKASIRFACVADAQRCLNRINGQDVFGYKINVRLSGEDTDYNLMKNKSLSQHNLNQNFNYNREDYHQKPGVFEVSNLPMNKPFERIKTRFNRQNRKIWTENYGETPQFVETAQTFLNRVNGQDVFGKTNIARGFGEDSTYNQMKNKSQSQQNLAQNSGKYLSKRMNGPFGENRNQIVSSPQTGHSRHIRRQNDSSVLSVIRGLNTKREEGVTHTVRKIVRRWRDNLVKSDFVHLVKRDGKCSDKDGEVLLFVTATSSETSQALITAAAKYWQSMPGLKWEPKRSSTKDSHLESNASDFDHISSQFSSTQDLSRYSSHQSLYETPVKTKESKRKYSNDYRQSSPDECLSVLKGLFTRSNDNLIELVRYLVNSWNDPNIKPEFVSDVKINFKRGTTLRRDGKHNLFVTAINELACTVLVNGAKQHIKTEGIVWDSFIQTKYRESFIEGLDIQSGQNLKDSVKKLVLDWNDEEINPNFIHSVIYDKVNGRELLVVTATSSDKSKALVSGAKKYLNTESGIKWFFTRRLEKNPETTNTTTIIPIPVPRKSKITQNEPIQPSSSIFTDLETSSTSTSETISSLFYNRLESLKTGQSYTPIEESGPKTKLKSSLDSNIIYSPTLPFEYDINDRMTNDLTLSINGLLFTSSECLTIDFMAKSDVDLRLEVKLKQSYVGLKSKVNGIWSPEERPIQSFPLSGRIFEIIIEIDTNRYIISVNGKYYCDYGHRVVNNLIDVLSISGDVGITCLRFNET